MMVGQWDQRQLCPDGSCIGVIGDNGQCKVCGRVAPNWGDERNRGLVASTTDEDEEEADDKSEDDVDQVSEAAPAEWSDRKLCPDGGCIGVIGDDGKCNVCGKRPDEASA
jgi:hypothetical protein